MSDILLNVTVDENEVNILREKFTEQYCKEKGWKKESLTPVQLLEISNQPQFKNPLMLRS